MASTPRDIDLAELARSIALPAPLHFQRRAEVWLSHLRNDGSRLRVGGIELDWFDALRAQLNLRNGQALSNMALARACLERSSDGGEVRIAHDAEPFGVAHAAEFLRGTKPRIERVTVRERAISTARLVAYLTRVEARRALQRRHPNLPAGSPAVLVVLRERESLRHVVPVAQVLKQKHGIDTWFGTADAAGAQAAAEAGFQGFDLHQAAQMNVATLFGEYGTVLRKTFRRLASIAPGDFSDEEAALLRAVTRRVVTLGAFDVLQIAHATTALLARGHFKLVVAPTAYTMEGRVAWRLASASRVATATMEHGTMFRGDPVWTECEIDCFSAWGPPSKAILVENGVRPDRIAVTGAPHLDGVIASAQKAGRPSTPTVLVATSGPGDLVSEAQHLHFIDVLYRAAELAPEIRWTVKLHRKDRRELYRAFAEARPTGRVEFIEGGAGRDIFESLRECHAMLTVTSASALEAMIVRVPVMTVAVTQAPLGETGIEFVDRQCTAHVRDGAALAEAAQRAARGELAPELERAVAGFVGEHFSNLGKAAPEVAARWAALVTRRS